MPLIRRVHLDNLRNADPVTLDMVVQEALRRPLVQLTAATVADICALSEVDSLPKNLRKGLQTFAKRMGPEIADLPDGEPFLAALADFESVPGTHIPTCLRDHWFTQIDQRNAELGARVQLLLDRWKNEPAEVLVPGTGKPLIHRVKVQEEPVNKPVAKARTSGEKPPKAEKPSRAAPVKLVDQDRQKWIRDTLLERLDDYIEQGLREDVLSAGVRHRGRATYPDLTLPEIMSVLRDLQTAGRVKHSAGRWRRLLTW